MSSLLHINYDHEEIQTVYSNANDHENSLVHSDDVIDNATLSRTVEKNNESTAKSSKEDIQEKQNIETNPKENSTTTKNYNVREYHETSPFKLAVKGFVINKLNKKVGSSHLLSGLKEKLVKKLEEGIDNSPSLYSPSDKNRSITFIKESDSELSLNSVPCELQSIVANDSHEMPNIEEAVECIEEAKVKASVALKGGKIQLKTQSLPSSPAHQFIHRPPTDLEHSSDSEENSSVSESTNVPSFSSKLFQNSDSVPLSQDVIELTELNRINPNETLQSSIPPDAKSLGCVVNAYGGVEKKVEKLFDHHKYRSVFRWMKHLLASMPLPQLFLLAFIVLPNFHLPYFLWFVIEGLGIAYLCYSLVLLVINVKVPDEHSTTNGIQKTPATPSVNKPKTYKASVKILKGKYNSEEQNHSTDLVDISIEDGSLKISRHQSSADSSANEQSYAAHEIHDISGANVSIVPTGLIKRRIFRKRYPICVTLPLASKQSSATGKKDPKSVPYDDEDGLCETPKQRALYLFALTDRDKESLFWALKTNAEPGDDNDCVQSCTPKLDLSSMSYLSLLETNTDESLSVTEDDHGNTEIKMSPIKAKPSLAFDQYMKSVFDNYKRAASINESLSSPEDPKANKEDTKPNHSGYSVEWLNVAVGRLFYDFITQKCWSDYVMAKIQKKLDQIEMPTFVQSLKVTEVFMGTTIPEVHTVSNPILDDRGVWFEFDFAYNGSFQMTLESRLKMPKARSQERNESPECADPKQNMDVNGTSDDGNVPKTQLGPNRFLNKIEKWVSHKHFQTVAQSRFVKKYVGDISNMTLALTVEVHMVHGVLALNMPPVPSDRVWYGFKEDPVLSLTATPKVGTHSINVSAVVQTIEQKLIRAFKKAIVMPNMDDLMIPIMFTPIYKE